MKPDLNINPVNEKKVDQTLSQHGKGPSYNSGSYLSDDIFDQGKAKTETGGEALAGPKAPTTNNPLIKNDQLKMSNYCMTGPKTIIIAGGGTGGHIYPGLAIAKAIQKIEPSAQVQFVGTPLGLEKDIVPREGYRLHLISVGKLNHEGGLIGKLRTLIQIPKALFRSAMLLFELKPYYVLGVGGYASGPFVLMASLLGFRAAIWEPNAFPGLTNRWLSRFVRQAFVVFKESSKYLKSRKIAHIGLPVRSSISAAPKSDQANHEFSKQNKFHILVFGGSQGAKALNEIVQKTLLSKKAILSPDFEFVHQTGRSDYARVSETYHGLTEVGEHYVKCHDYLYDMENHYRWADLVICRSGANTVAELAACGKPSILIPLPTAADDHQTKNALCLVDLQAAMLIPQKDLSVDLLVEKILEIKNNDQRRIEMGMNASKFHRPNSAEKIAQFILDV